MSEERELVWGIKNGDIDQVKDIIETQKIDLNVPIDGRVLLHYAADYGQTAVLNYLLDKGADPNGASKSGKTPDGTPYIEAAEKEEIKDLLT
ncbi:Tankyrase [Operophtera brumata]|uniref:Tankyrase n=1 Tax=Operophtera brumata TaxID=104452 RepID=A0A0L7LDC1_OPEBR|nr:Tankyrase [Operophtera brumata]